MKRRLLLLIIASFMLFPGCQEREAEVNFEVNREDERQETEEPVEETPVVTEEKKEDGYVTIDLQWDESNVTFFSNSKLQDLSLSDVCQPVLKIEGESVERESGSNGNIHTEKLTIKDPDEYVNIFVEPCQPTNDCPLDTVTATITYADGQVKNLASDEMKTRGQTGIWYVQVYTQN